MANTPDNFVQLWVKQGFATANRDNRRAQFRQPVDPAQHGLDRDRFREIVIFITVRAGKVTAADRYDVSHDRMPARLHGLGYNAGLT
jgi:hypothetical protein